MEIAKRLRRARVKNFQQRLFLPSESLTNVLTDDVVRGAVAAFPDDLVEAYDRPHIVKSILKGGLKTFATLLLIEEQHLITVFIQNDQMKGENIDYGLPFPKAYLEKLIPQQYEEFYDQQWEVSIPRFQRGQMHKILSDETIMPFVVCEEFKRGGFGRISRVDIWASQQDFDEKCASVFRLVQKEMDDPQTAEEDFEVEKRNLSLLRYLEHPNVVNLLGSFTLNKRHYLLFPVAERNLNDLMTAPTPDPLRFEKDSDYCRALVGLASAVHHVHSYTSAALDLALIGCHYDLKPTNVLVSGREFLLADFGISRFKKITEDSKTIFKIGGGEYSAPECPNIIDEFKKHPVGRASDIWSFGCIVVELVVFMTLGAKGVMTVRNVRKETNTDFCYTTRTFYKGKELNPRLDDWLSDLRLTSIQSDLMHLARSCLKSEPDARPKSNNILQTLREISLRDAGNRLKESIAALEPGKFTFELHIETKRIHIWLSTALLDVSPSPLPSSRDHSYNQIISVIDSICQEIEAFSHQKDNAQIAQCQRLRLLIDELDAMLPSNLLKRVRAHLEIEILGIESSEELVHVAYAFEHYNIGQLAATKHMILLSQSTTKSAHDIIEVQNTQVQEIQRLGSHSIAMVTLEDNKDPVKCLMEWVEYDAHWSDPKDGQELFNRVGQIASLHQRIADLPSRRLLTCRGYYHSAAHRAFGLLFQLPREDLTHESNLESLSAKIESTKNHPACQPSLGRKFELAVKIATAVSDLHRIGWLHKSISAQNVVFDGDVNSSVYLIGLNHSRPNDCTVISDGIRMRGKDWAQRQEYQHPIYRRDGVRYCIQYDYFSLGMLLLELGLWKSITSKLFNRKEQSPTEKLDYVIEMLVPLLDVSVGLRYRQAVLYCLKSATPDNGIVNDRRIEAEFFEKVIQEISSCSV